MTYSFVGLLISSAVIALCCSVVNGVPVLVWDSTKIDNSQGHSSPPIIGKEEFKNYLSKKMEKKYSLPKVVVFVEKDLSVEDFSWRDERRRGYFTGIEELIETVPFEFFQNVSSPIESIQCLIDYGYAIQYWSGEGSVPDDDDQWNRALVVMFNSTADKTRSLRRHDELMVATYYKLLETYTDVMVVYTGLQSAWEIDYSSRHDMNGKETQVNLYNELIFMIWQTKQVLMISKDFPALSDIDTVEYFVKMPPPNVTMESDNDMLLQFNAATPVTLVVHFALYPGYWKLESITNVRSINNIKFRHFLIPLLDISAPAGMSWYSGSKVIFICNDSMEEYFTFTDLQVQYFFNNKSDSFSPAVDVVTFFTIEIWTVIFVVTILITILLFGISMIMDIKVPDQFDDPKGPPLPLHVALKD